MPLTILALDGNTLRRMRESRNYLETLGYTHTFDQVLGRDVIVVKEQIDVVPSALRGLVEFVFFVIEQKNSPFRGVPAGSYKEGDITARVATYYSGGRLQQSFRVSGPQLGSLSNWFDDLVAGNKNEFCANPAPLPEQPVMYAEDVVAARSLLESMFEQGFAGRNLAEILADCEKLQGLLSGRPEPRDDNATDALKQIEHIVEAAISAGLNKKTQVEIAEAILDINDVLLGVPTIHAEQEPAKRVNLDEARRLVEKMLHDPHIHALGLVGIMNDLRNISVELGSSIEQ